MNNQNEVRKKSGFRLWIPILVIAVSGVLILTITASARSTSIRFIEKVNSISETFGLTVYLPIIRTSNEVIKFPNTDNYEWVTLATGLDRPIELTAPDDGSGRLFIVGQRGEIMIYENGSLLSTPFLDIDDQVVELNPTGDERGLLGLAFDPDYANNGLFYVYYIDNANNTVVSQFGVSADPNVADPASETEILTLHQPANNHNGGHIEFGPDGYLYIGLGDGGGGNDPDQLAQDLSNLFGAILRIDVSSLPYTIPTDNPFVGTQWQEEIWVYGLRNPWKYGFDTQTGDLYIGDVGQGSWEEIDYLPTGTPGGTNFGWDYYEGNVLVEGTPPDDVDFTFPVHVYPTHIDGTCAVTGGVVYRGSMAEWDGIYIYGDYCSGSVWGLQQDSREYWYNQFLYASGVSISSFGYDPDGNVYITGLGGEILQLQEK